MKNIFRHCLGPSAIFYTILLFSGVGAYAQAITHQVVLPAGASWCDDGMINGLFSQINTFRAINNVPALRMDPLGMEDAELRATQFAAYMAGNSPSEPGFNPHQGYDTTAAGLGYNIISENLAYMTSDPLYVVDVAWQDSLHIAAMVARDANIAGVSCIYWNSIPYWSYEPGCSPDFCGQSFPISTPPSTPPSGATTTSTTTSNTTSTPVLDSEESNFLTLINNYRAQNGAGALQVSAALENSSQWMSNDMATNNYASHTDSLGRSPGTRLAAFNYPYTPWGENIAGGFGDAQNALNQWISACDPDGSGNCTYAHRQNMLNPAFVVIGIGRAYSSASTYGWYWTTDFGGVLDQTINPNPSSTSPPSITAFTATPSVITAGQGSSLGWSVSGATSVSLDNGIGSVSGNSKAVAPAQTTTYTLTATNSGGSVTGRVTITVNAASDTQAPTPPVLISATGKGSTEVDLAWTASMDNVGVTGYQVLRNGAAIGTVGGTTLTYADTSVSTGASYSYTVKAFDAAKNYSAASNSMSVTIAATAPVSGGSTGSTGSTACPAPATNAFTGCYYNNIALTGNPTFIRTDSQINFNWYWSPPDPSVSANSFSVRWQGYFNFDAGSYIFTAITSDGMRIYIDGSLILDRWRDQAPTMYTLRPTISQGTHLVVVEYYEETRTATAQVSWRKN